MTTPMEEGSVDHSLTEEQKLFFEDGLADKDRYLKAIDEFVRIPLANFKQLFCLKFNGGQFKDCLPDLRNHLGNAVSKKLFNGITFKLIRFNENTVVEQIHNLSISLVNASLSENALKIFNFKGITDNSSDGKGIDSDRSDLSAILSTVLKELEEVKSTLKSLKDASKQCLCTNSEVPLNNIINKKVNNNNSCKKKRALSQCDSEIIHVMSKTPRTSYTTAPKLGKLNTGTDSVFGIATSKEDVQSEWTTVLKKNNKQIMLKTNNSNSKSYPLRKKPKKVITGSANTDSVNLLSGVPKKRYYRVNKVSNDTDIDGLKNYIISFLKVKSDELVIENITNSKYNFYKMFKVTTDCTHASAMEDPQNWPNHIEVSRFFNPKPIKTSFAAQADNKTCF